jgi:stearoyl-CoA desaturase (delta-9 desaturase)
MKRIRNWDTFLFIFGYHAFLVIFALAAWSAISWTAATLFLFTFIAGGISITAGYHRLYAHKAYEAHPLFEWAVLLSSTLALQWSALIWSYDHRIHHNHVDTDEDPYSIKKGFWYAHMGWLFDYKRDFNPALVKDLLANPRVVFQDRHYLLLSLLVNAAVFGVGCLFMSPFASFYFGVVLRVAAIHHCTWFINSLAHTIGSKTYARELSAVDNAVLAFLTFGEGYHNYHHAFAADYRNGVRWYHFDPTKWLIWTASKLGFASKLKSIQTIRVQRALVEKDRRLLVEHLREEMDELAHEIANRLEELSLRFEALSSKLMATMRELKSAEADRRRELKREVRRLREDLRLQWREWVELTRQATRQYQLDHAH